MNGVFLVFIVRLKKVLGIEIQTLPIMIEYSLTKTLKSI